MENRKNIFIFLLGIVLIVSLFITSFLWGINKFTKSQSPKNNNLYHGDKKEVIDDNTRIVLKLRDNTSGKLSDYEVLNLVQLEDSIGKSVDKSRLEEFYSKQGYSLYSYNDKEFIFIKDVVPKFEPNKYYLGVENGCLAIYKSDSEGKLYIEDHEKDVTQKTVDSLPDGDKQLFKNYELKFNTKQEAYDILAEIQS